MAQQSSSMPLSDSLPGSPQRICPTTSGVVDALFGGTTTSHVLGNSQPHGASQPMDGGQALVHTTPPSTIDKNEDWCKYAAWEVRASVAGQTPRHGMSLPSVGSPPPSESPYHIRSVELDLARRTRAVSADNIRLRGQLGELARLSLAVQSKSTASAMLRDAGPPIHSVAGCATAPTPQALPPHHQPVSATEPAAALQQTEGNEPPEQVGDIGATSPPGFGTDGHMTAGAAEWLRLMALPTRLSSTRAPSPPPRHITGAPAVDNICCISPPRPHTSRMEDSIRPNVAGNSVKQPESSFAHAENITPLRPNAKPAPDTDVLVALARRRYGDECWAELLQGSTDDVIEDGQPSIPPIINPLTADSTLPFAFEEIAAGWYEASHVPFPITTAPRVVDTAALSAAEARGTFLGAYNSTLTTSLGLHRDAGSVTAIDPRRHLLGHRQ